MRITILLLLVVALCSCQSKIEYAEILTSHVTEPVEHTAWTKLLAKHVDADGWVNYEGFIADSVALNAYLELLSANPPSETWQDKEQLAYWINVYNAFTVKVIVDHYPLESITDIKAFHIPLVNTVWQDAFIPIGDQTLSLDFVEHQILRKEFDEPRIHFAIVCASISCPKLRNEAYEPMKLERQLTEQAIEFINDPSRNTIAPDAIELSKIFSWFKGDFTKNGSLINYINQYSDIKVNKSATISFGSYDWGLNDQKQR